MEYLDSDLESMLLKPGQRKLALAVRLKIYLRLLESLDILHSTQVAHCDLKFEKVMYVKDDGTEDSGRYKFIGFSMAQSKKPCDSGTNAYIAPEAEIGFLLQAYNIEAIDAYPNWRFQSDVYSIAVMIPTVQDRCAQKLLDYNESVTEQTESDAKADIKMYKKLLENISSRHLIPAAVEFAFVEAYKKATGSTVKPPILNSDYNVNEMNVYADRSQENQLTYISEIVHRLVNSFAFAGLRPEPFMRPTTKTLKRVMMILSNIADRILEVTVTKERHNIDHQSEHLHAMNDYLHKTNDIQASTITQTSKDTRDGSNTAPPGSEESPSLHSDKFEKDEKSQKMSMMSESKSRLEKELMEKLTETTRVPVTEATPKNADDQYLFGFQYIGVI